MFYNKIAYILSYAKKCPFFIGEYKSLDVKPHLKSKIMSIFGFEHGHNCEKPLTTSAHQFFQSNDAVWLKWVRSPKIPNFMKIASTDQKL